MKLMNWIPDKNYKEDMVVISCKHYAEIPMPLRVMGDPHHTDSK